MNRTVEGTTKVWLTEHCGIGPEDIKSGDAAMLVRCVTFSSHDMSNCGWTLVGEANVAITFVDGNQILNNKIDALRAEKQKTLADAQVKANELEAKIQKLLAISYDQEAA